MKLLEIQLYFSILILPSRALKHWNIPHSLDFKGKTVAKFPRRSHFLSAWKIWQQNNKLLMRPFKNYLVQWDFIPLVSPSLSHSVSFNLSTCITLCQFYYFASPVLFTRNKTLLNERKGNFLYIWLLQRITLYQGS